MRIARKILVLGCAAVVSACYASNRPGEEDASVDEGVDCTPITGFLIDEERMCVDFSSEVFMGCRDSPSFTLLIETCFVNGTTGIHVYRADQPTELHEQGWSLCDEDWFALVDRECE